MKGSFWIVCFKMTVTLTTNTCIDLAVFPEQFSSFSEAVPVTVPIPQVRAQAEGSEVACVFIVLLPSLWCEFLITQIACHLTIYLDLPKIS